MPSSKQVYQAIKDDIEYGRYEAGEYLDVSEIAEANTVSAVPVREALLRLSERGLLEWKPRRGFSVARLSRQEVEFFHFQLKSGYLMAIDRLRCDVKYTVFATAIDRALFESVPANVDAYNAQLRELDRLFFSRAEQAFMDMTRSRLWYVRKVYFAEQSRLCRLGKNRKTIVNALLSGDLEFASDMVTTNFDHVENCVASLFDAK